MAGGVHTPLVLDAAATLLRTLGKEALAGIGSLGAPTPVGDAALALAIFAPADPVPPIDSPGTVMSSASGGGGGGGGRDSTVELDPDEVVAFLRAGTSASCGWDADAIAIAYLENRVHALGDVDPKRHTLLAELYLTKAAKLLADASGPLTDRVRRCMSCCECQSFDHRHCRVCFAD